MNRRGQQSLVFSTSDAPPSTSAQSDVSMLRGNVRVDDQNQVITSPKTGAFFAVIVLLSFIFVMSVACTAMLAVNVGMANSQSDRIDKIMNALNVK